MIIAVDGPTASGKGTIARALADHFGLPVLDTGLLYRAVGYQTQLNHGDPDDARDAFAACDFPGSLLDDPALRYESTGGLASRVSVHPEVRKALFQRQVDWHLPRAHSGSSPEGQWCESGCSGGGRPPEYVCNARRHTPGGRW